MQNLISDARIRDDYADLYRDFYWHVPPQFNIAQVCCHRWAKERHRLALYHENTLGEWEKYTYWDLQQQAYRLSNALKTMGLRQGDCVAIVLPQSPETIVAHIACYQMGLTAMPLSVLFGPEALEYRLQDSSATAIILEYTAWQVCAPLTPHCPALKHAIVVYADGKKASDRGDFSGHEYVYADLLRQSPPNYTPIVTQADDPALLIYTSGTTGPPKGALKAQRALIGNLPGFVASQNWFPQEGDIFWTPADWAWTGGLMDALLPTLYFGHTIVSCQARSGARFDPHKAWRLLESLAITNVFLFPTALKMMMKAAPHPRSQYQLKLRAIMSAGESLGSTLFDWANDALGLRINEMCGQTEINYVVGNSGRWQAKPGSIGRAYPGHQVAVIDTAGKPLPPGEVGELAVNRYDIHGYPDPVFFLGYWNNAKATQAKFSGDWCRTGDEAIMDKDGYFWYQGRADDMFKSAGYRIGPSEVENCLLRHPAVVNAAVIPKPDPLRGAIVKACIVLADGVSPSDSLKEELQTFVRSELAPYESPREIEFMPSLPMTTTGKVQRRILRLAEEKRSQNL